MISQKGKFIVFEGIDGSGKGTQLDLLVKELEKKGRTVFRTAEPTFSATGGIIRDTLGGFQQKTEYELAALFLTDRIHHCENPVNGIRQFLEKGIDVVCDRYYYSSFAYQGIDANLDWVMRMNLDCDLILKPDICLFLDISPEACMQRIEKNRLSKEIYENINAQNRIRKRFLEVFSQLENTENIKIVDASRSVEEVSADIMALITQILF